MLIEKIPEWDLSSQDDAEIAALLARCFPTDFGGRSYFIQHHHLRLVVRQPQIIGHMALVLRSVQLGDRLVSIAGLAEVATDPAHRGQGIAAQLLQAAIAEAKASPAEFMLLYGVAKLYAAAGFRYISNPLAHVDLRGPQTRRVTTDRATNLMVLPLRGTPWPDDAPLDLRGPEF
jgi:predicted N-acetyltransferase YhbS